MDGGAGEDEFVELLPVEHDPVSACGPVVSAAVAEPRDAAAGEFVEGVGDLHGVSRRVRGRPPTV